jgi:hypothetical protein
VTLSVLLRSILKKKISVTVTALSEPEETDESSPPAAWTGAAGMHATIAELGRQTGSMKLASTALVRNIAKGALSPATIQRAAKAMPEGSFRFVKNLGRGNFTLADQVVGRVGEHAGLMARKLPTQALDSIPKEFGPLAKQVNQLNARHGRFYQAPPIAPYAGVTPQGAFQQMAEGRVWHMPRGLKKQVTDLHEGNVGPRGQVIDFGTESGAANIASKLMRPRIDAGAVMPSSNNDLFGNLDVMMPKAVRDQVQPAVERSNNLVRRYWATPSTERQQYLDGLTAGAPDRKIKYLGELSAAQQHARANADTAPMKPGFRDALKMLYYDWMTRPRAERFATAGAAGAAAAGGYGLYNYARHR